MARSTNSRLAEDLDGTFEELVREHQDRLYSLALRYTASPRDAEELTQDALVRAYRALREYEPDRIRELNVRGWLTTILLNLSRNHRRRPVAPVVQLDPMIEPANPGTEWPEATIERREAARHWAGLVAGLPPRYRAAVLLRHLDGFSYPELATLLGRPEGTVKAQVHRGIELLRAAFQASQRADAAAIGAAAAADRADEATERQPRQAAGAPTVGPRTPSGSPAPQPRTPSVREILT